MVRSVAAVRNQAGVKAVDLPCCWNNCCKRRRQRQNCWRPLPHPQFQQMMPSREWLHYFPLWYGDGIRRFDNCSGWHLFQYYVVYYLAGIHHAFYKLNAFSCAVFTAQLMPFLLPSAVHKNGRANLANPILMFPSFSHWLICDWRFGWFLFILIKAPAE